MWEIVNSTEELPAATLRGTTVVYFFLTKDIAILYILLPPRAPEDLGLRLKVRLRRRTTRLPVNLLTININYNSLLVHRNIVFFGRFFFFVGCCTILQVDDVEPQFNKMKLVSIHLSRMFVSTHKDYRFHYEIRLALDLVSLRPVAYLINLSVLECGLRVFVHQDELTTFTHPWLELDSRIIPRTGMELLNLLQEVSFRKITEF